MSAGPTPSQTIGPFFHPTLMRDPRNVVAGPDVAGERIRIEGRVLDADGGPVEALVELWQANSHGKYPHPADTRDLPLEPDFLGFGRSDTDDEGRYWFETVKPGPVPFVDGSPQAPHLSLTIFGRGLLNHVATRLYFADDRRTERDPILQRVPAARRPTLLARRETESGPYRFDVVLQGPPERETVFFRFAR